MDSQEPVLWSEAVEEWFRKMKIPWREMSPEEYAARHSHEIYCFSLDQVRIRDPELAAWARRLHEILFNPAEIKRLRRECLTVEEYRQVRREIAACRRTMTDLEQGRSESERGGDK
jgi:hypothetical protein